VVSGQPAGGPRAAGGASRAQAQAGGWPQGKGTDRQLATWHACYLPNCYSVLMDIRGRQHRCRQPYQHSVALELCALPPRCRTHYLEPKHQIQPQRQQQLVGQLGSCPEVDALEVASSRQQRQLEPVLHQLAACSSAAAGGEASTSPQPAGARAESEGGLMVPPVAVQAALPHHMQYRPSPAAIAQGGITDLIFGGLQQLCPAAAGAGQQRQGSTPATSAGRLATPLLLPSDTPSPPGGSLAASPKQGSTAGAPYNGSGTAGGWRGAKRAPSRAASPLPELPASSRPDFSVSAHRSQTPAGIEQQLARSLQGAGRGGALLQEQVGPPRGEAQVVAARGPSVPRAGWRLPAGTCLAAKAVSICGPCRAEACRAAAMMPSATDVRARPAASKGPLQTPCPTRRSGTGRSGRQ
jgi:hypothetical protein